MSLLERLNNAFGSAEASLRTLNEEQERAHISAFLAWVKAHPDYRLANISGRPEYDACGFEQRVIDEYLESRKS